MIFSIILSRALFAMLILENDIYSILIILDWIWDFIVRFFGLVIC